MQPTITEELPKLTSDERQKLSALARNLPVKSEELIVIFAILKANRPLTTQQIMLVADIRQPIVSIGTSILCKRRWLTVESIERTGKGRPEHCYSLNVHKVVVHDYYKKLLRQFIRRMESDFALFYKL